VLDDLSVLEAEDVGRGGAPVVGRRLEQAVRHDEVPLRNRTLDLDLQVGKLARVPLHEADESLRPVGGLGVVLDVLRTDVALDRVLGLLVVERPLVKRDHGLLVLLCIGHDVQNEPPAQRIPRFAAFPTW
jgi:hypothetical protein